MSAAVVCFPRPMKRGAKVRRGPCAQVLHFPTPLSGAKLHAEWEWLSGNNAGWCDERLPEPGDLVGFDQAEFNRQREVSGIVRAALGRKPKTDGDLRRDVAEWRAKIEKRAQVKDWLEVLGVNWKEAFEPERALFFAFDQLRARIPLESA